MRKGDDGKNAQRNHCGAARQYDLPKIRRFHEFGGGRRFGGLRHESCAEGEGREPRKDNFH